MANLDLLLFKPKTCLSSNTWCGLRRITLTDSNTRTPNPLSRNHLLSLIPSSLDSRRQSKAPSITCTYKTQLCNCSPIPFPSHSTGLTVCFSLQAPTKPLLKNLQRNLQVSAGRSKKKPGGPSTGRIEGNAEVRREARKASRRRARRTVDKLFFRKKNSSGKNSADDFTEEELEMIGLGYDRMVRFMDKDDPNLRHPYDWYKYGEFGPFSWRGVVIGEPIRGRFSDERVSMFGSVKDHEEWEKIEQFDMATEYSRRLGTMNKEVGFKYFWVFVRHPRWKLEELPWKQWTLVCEVVVESGEKKLDKWKLMGRFGNTVRALITKCAAWMRPDIIYVKRPVYQCRFEPQEDFFKCLWPLLDPESEKEYLFEAKVGEGKTEICTYFGGLCKIVRANPKAFVDDVVKAYEKLTDERKSDCWDFLLSNHPVPLLHPYTREWKAKLKAMGTGYYDEDQISSDEDEVRETRNWGEYEEEDEVDEEGETRNWSDYDEEDDKDEEGETRNWGDHEDDEDEDKVVEGDVELGIREEEARTEEIERYWEEEFEKAVRSSEAMENLVRRSVEASTELYKRQLRARNQMKKETEELGQEEERIRPKPSREEWEHIGYDTRRIRKRKIPPELFLRAAVRPFTYRNLLKEIVLMRHAIVEQRMEGKI
ncbi:hypothetical protein AMTRI_Chr09g21900 [Amborella trichopoda]